MGKLPKTSIRRPENVGWAATLRAIRPAAIAIAVALLVAGLTVRSFAAGIDPLDGRYKGRTAQGKAVYFQVSGRTVKNPTFTVDWGECGVQTAHYPGASDEVDESGRFSIDTGQTVLSGRFVSPVEASGTALFRMHPLAGCPRVEVHYLARHAPYPTNFVQFKLKAGNGKRTFSGQIAAPTSKCVKGRTVEVIRKHNGNQQVLGKNGTNSDGRFSISLSSGEVKNGTYYAKAKVKKYDNDEKVCEAAQSFTIKVS
jgi:hypothetical protein